jgi:hypothetical protein
MIIDEDIPTALLVSYIDKGLRAKGMLHQRVRRVFELTPHL